MTPGYSPHGMGITRVNIFIEEYIDTFSSKITEVIKCLNYTHAQWVNGHLVYNLIFIFNDQDINILYNMMVEIENLHINIILQSSKNITILCGSLYLFHCIALQLLAPNVQRN